MQPPSRSPESSGLSDRFGASGSSSGALPRRALLRGAAGLTGLAGLGALAACSSVAPDSTSGTAQPVGATGAGEASATVSPTPATPAQIAARAVVPVLCYHQVRDWTGEDSQYTRENLVIPPAKFREQLDGMTQAGYTAISADQYYAHLTNGAELPAKPVLLSFDDGKDNQSSQAAAELAKRGMTGTFFIMSVVIGNSGWVTKDELKKIADSGMTIGSHTWDHHRVDKYTAADLQEQLVKPRETLAKITGQPVLDFAYPYGAWNDSGAALVAKAGYRSGYQLMDKPVSPKTPLYTLRRQLAVSTWSGPEVVAKLEGFATAGRDTTYSAG